MVSKTKPDLVPMHYKTVKEILAGRDLNQIWDKDQCACFKYTKAQYGALSNFAPIPIKVGLLGGDIDVKDSERLFQALKFPFDESLQKDILGAVSPREAKAIARANNSKRRADWNKISLHIMYWVLRTKLASAPKLIGAVLEETEDKPIVEVSSNDNFWGARPRGDHLVGANMLGAVWMQIRKDWRIRSKGCRSASVRAPDKSSGWMLLGKPIYSII